MIFPRLSHVLARCPRTIRVGAFAILMLAAGRLNGQNLISNGDFEIGPYFSRGMVGGWTVGGPGFIAVNGGNANDPMDPTYEGSTTGNFAACLNEGGNTQNNTLSQTIPTTPGQTYVFEWDGGVFGMPTSTLQVRFQAIGNTIRFDETIAPPVINMFKGVATEFHHYFRMFTADSSATTIRFTDVGLGNAQADMIIDTVSVIPMPGPTPSPTPAQLPLLNGDFETWPFNYPGVVANWTLGGNQHIETITQGATSPQQTLPYPAFNRGHSAGFSVGGDSFNNTMSQTFITTPGQNYNFRFDAGVFGQRSGANLKLRAQIFGATQLFSMDVTPPDVGALHPVDVPFQSYQFTFLANSTFTTVQFTDLVGANGGADLMLDTVSILPVVPSFSSWQSANFTFAQRNDPNFGGWSADPDVDGVRNGLEYYFHMNPTAGIPAADVPLQPRIGLISSNGSTYLTFSYRRLMGGTANTAVVAVSDDLVTWDTGGTQIEQVGPPGRGEDGFTEVITVRLKTPLPGVTKKHFRLMLTQ